MNLDSRILVLGSTGLVGSAIVRNLKANGYSNVIEHNRKNNHGVSISDSTKLFVFLKENQIDYVFLAAAKVGGIAANSTYPADFITDNLRIQTSVITACKSAAIKKLIFLGSSCIYPKFATQPIKESEFMKGELEPSNEPYAIAKIAGIRMLQAYTKQYGFSGISLMPTNLYGPFDNYHPENSHVLPALIRRFHEAKVNSSKQVVLWGTGTPCREFLHVDDMADATVFLANNYDSPEIINVGYGSDVTIIEVANIIADVVGYNGDVVFDTSRPDGTPRKLLDSSKLFDMGWKPKIPLKVGITLTYNSFLKGEGRGI